MEKLKAGGQPKRTFKEMFEPAMTFLASPWNTWDSGIFEARRIVLKLVFAEHLAYCRNEGFRTPKTTLPFKVLAAIQGPGMDQFAMAEGGGFEPPTPFGEHAFQACALSHSAIPPGARLPGRRSIAGRGGRAKQAARVRGGQFA